MPTDTKTWTMKDVQGHLHDILQADHPLTQDQRKALKGTIEMCEIWEKISPHFAKAVQQLEQERAGTAPPTLSLYESQIPTEVVVVGLPPCSSCRSTTCPNHDCCGYCHHALQ